jgi:hypothetical protein
VSATRLALFVLAFVIVLTGFLAINARHSKAMLQVQAQDGGKGGTFVISGTGFGMHETVSLEVKNTPLSSPSGWHLGTTETVNGQFSFHTEEFSCVHIDDAELREQYREQRVLFVATGLSSGQAATVVSAAGTAFVCRE